jgi:hypothetical protein
MRISGRVIDVMGQEVMVFADTDKLDISMLSEGIYFVQTGSGITMNFVIQK